MSSIFPQTTGDKPAPLLADDSTIPEVLEANVHYLTFFLSKLDYKQWLNIILLSYPIKKSETKPFEASVIGSETNMERSKQTFIFQNKAQERIKN